MTGGCCTKNPRYATFAQPLPTAGDAQQFDEMVGGLDTYPIEVTYTFRYIFSKFKKGIFVHIHANTLVRFVPFCKVHFINENGSKMQVDPAEFESFDTMFDYIHGKSGRKSLRPTANIKKGWWHNNGIFRYDIPRVEMGAGLDKFHGFLERVARRLDPAKHYVFFVNNRDFPIVTLRDGMEPYDSIHGNFETPLVSHSYPRMCPVFSMTSSANHADIAMPNWEDIDSGAPETKTVIVETEWKNKRPVAVFRGSSTGLGTTAKTNPRIKVCELARKHSGLLDVGITKWNLRPRKLPNDPYYRTIAAKVIATYPIVEFMDYSQQSQYKYLINLPGYVSSFRLARLLSLRSVVLHVQSPYHSWFENSLRPYVHYVPVKPNLSDLAKQIVWCIEHDGLCRTIAENAYKFYCTRLCADAQETFMATHLNMLHEPTIPAPRPAPDELAANTTIVTVKWPLRKFRPSSSTLFVSSDNTQFLKLHLTPQAGKRYTHEFTVYRDVLAKLESGYGWRAVHGFARNGGGAVYTVMEYVDRATTLLEFMADPTRSPDFETVMLTMMQVCLNLDDAQGTFGFVHNDCVPWNILIQKIPPTTQILPCREHLYRFTDSWLHVTLIDYDKSYTAPPDADNNDAVGLLVHVMHAVLAAPHRWAATAVATCEQWFRTVFRDDADVPPAERVRILDLYRKYDNLSSFVMTPHTTAADVFAMALAACPPGMRGNIERMPGTNRAFALRRLLT